MVLLNYTIKQKLIKRPFINETTIKVKSSSILPVKWHDMATFSTVAKSWRRNCADESYCGRITFWWKSTLTSLSSTKEPADAELITLYLELELLTFSFFFFLFLFVKCFHQLRSGLLVRAWHFARLGRGVGYSPYLFHTDTAVRAGNIINASSFMFPLRLLSKGHTCKQYFFYHC